MSRWGVLLVTLLLACQPSPEGTVDVLDVEHDLDAGVDTPSDTSHTTARDTGSADIAIPWIIEREPEPPVPFATLAELFDDGCTGGHCHSDGRVYPSLENDEGLYGRVLELSRQTDFALVEPYDPMSSYLFLKVWPEHEGASTRVGRTMPTSGALSDESLAILYDWIMAGAPSD